MEPEPDRSGDLHIQVVADELAQPAMEPERVGSGDEAGRDQALREHLGAAMESSWIRAARKDAGAANSPSATAHAEIAYAAVRRPLSGIDRPVASMHSGRWSFQ